MSRPKLPKWCPLHGRVKKIERTDPKDNLIEKWIVNAENAIKDIEKFLRDKRKVEKESRKHVQMFDRKA
jgi:hypothetical protein